MTNKELADKIEAYWWGRAHPDGRIADLTREACSRLRLSDKATPDHTTEPVKDLRWLVKRHECLSQVLRYQWNSPWPWAWKSDSPTDGETMLSNGKAITVVRGIVKGLFPGAQWEPYEAASGNWAYRETTSHKWQWKDTELEAIDALLTAMEGK